MLAQLPFCPHSLSLLPSLNTSLFPSLPPSLPPSLSPYLPTSFPPSLPTFLPTSLPPHLPPYLPTSPSPSIIPFQFSNPCSSSSPSSPSSSSSLLSPLPSVSTGRPIITWPPQPQVLSIGEPIVLRCKALGQPEEPDIRWLHDGIEVREGGREGGRGGKGREREKACPHYFVIWIDVD